MRQEIAFVVNGSPVSVSADSGLRLIDLLRDSLNLTGTKEGCGEGECGACTVLVDGVAVNACLYPAPEIEGREVTTIEGLVADDNQLGVIQQSFVDSGAIQCGFCSPGMILSSKALLDTRPQPDDEDIVAALVGNLCRCTGYVQIVEAVHLAARRIQEATTGGSHD